MELQIIFGSNVRNQRKATGITQEALAERADVTMETIGKIERGVAAPTFATAEKIARALEINVISLFGVGGSDLPDGERRRLFAGINHSLSGMNNDQLARVGKIIDAFLGG